MVVSSLNRFLLLALLPVIALVLYVAGQRYDPALIRFSESDAGAGREAEFFPAEIAGYAQVGTPRIFTKENLYEYVNGHAEYFLSAGFEGLAVGEYGKSGGKNAEPDVVVEIYNMGTDLQAFGVYSDEIGNDAVTVSVGSMGAKTAQGVSFVRGPYYVRMTTFQGAVPMEAVAVRIDERIGAGAGAMGAFSRFPDIGEVVATRYVKEDYRGLGFANHVIEREYRIGGQEIQVALTSGDRNAMTERLSSYLDFFKETGVAHTLSEANGRRIYRVEDPYEGNWYLIVFPETIVGVYGLENTAVLELLVAGLNKTTGTDKSIAPSEK